MARLIAKTRGAFGVVASLSLFLTHFTAWILAGVPATYRAMQENPLLVAQTGPGLWVVLGGALLVVTSAVISARRGA